MPVADITYKGTADYLSRKLRTAEKHVVAARKERDQLLNAIRKAATEYKAVKWGWDGDCGTDEIMKRLEANLPENVDVDASPPLTAQDHAKR